MIFHHDLIDKIIDKGVLIQDRAHFIILNIHNENIGFLNVYAPNKPNERKLFWDSLADSTPQASCWCLGGDFNMIERLEDRTRSNGSIIQRTELSAWERLSFQLGVSDIWEAHGFYQMSDSLMFSRTDRKVQGANMSTLDRFYASNFILSHGRSCPCAHFYAQN